MPSRLRASAIHLLLSCGIAALAAALVFGLWYPGAYRALSGGQSLFWLIVSVDIVLGPLLTLVVFNLKKPRAELVRDLAIIAALQLGALGYGLLTMYQARPVHLVFEVDRLRVVSAADIDPAALPQAPPGLQDLPLTGPTVIAARRAKDNDELMAAVTAASQGVEISMQPARWIPYADAERREALARAKAYATLSARPDLRDALAAAARDLGRAPEGLALLPAQSRFATWSAVLDERGEPIKLIPVDSF
jgi:hypothetical protein